MTFTETLRSIGESDAPPSTRDFKQLLDLEAGDRDAFQAVWQRIPAERRFDIAHRMAELAEDDVEFNFGEVWHWLLDDSEAGVRASAIEGMWEDTTPRALRRMIGILRDDTDPNVRAAAAVALGRFAYVAACGELDHGEEALRETLIGVILNENEVQDIRRRALESAGYFADADEIQRQIGLAYDSGEQLLRESALLAMGRSMLPRWLPTINGALKSASPALRYEAAHAAGEMAEEGRKLLPTLAPLVNDQDAEVAVTAIWALGQIGGDAARRTLEQLAKDSDTARSQAAREALDELSMERGIL
ncbi:MAG: HEAT repeat domain-containing protein [Blastochloris sp.]|nr:HEAT repeat domain-containing protein [Blastochloris sp.]